MLEKILLYAQNEKEKDITAYLNREIGLEMPLINFVKIAYKSGKEQLKDVEGEASGYVLNKLNVWQRNEQSLFFVLDGYSQLLCNLHFVLFNKFYLRNIMQKSPKTNKEDINILFLNRIYCKKNTVENHDLFLKSLQESFDLIIYSFGVTELDDDDFPTDYTDEFYEAIVKNTLTINNGWTNVKEVDFYIWEKSDGRK